MKFLRKKNLQKVILNINLKFKKVSLIYIFKIE